MVSLKRFALVGTTAVLLGAVYGMPAGSNNAALDVRVATSQEVEASERLAPNGLPGVVMEKFDTVRSPSDDHYDMTKRADIRMRLWWAQGGQVLFLLGRNLNAQGLPVELQNLIQGLGEGTPGQMLLRNFYNFIQQRHADLHEWLTDQVPNVGGQIGAIWGTAARAGDFGFGFNLPGGLTNPGTAGGEFLGMLVNAINEWASQNGAGAMISQQQRSNGFFNPADIGGGPSNKRSRTDQCPAKDYNVFKIANEVVPNDVDFKRYYRWVGPCP